MRLKLTFLGTVLSLLFPLVASAQLYGIESMDDKVYRIDESTAALTLLGPLNYMTAAEAGFTYDPVHHVAYASEMLDPAAFAVSLDSYLVTVDLTTGAATAIGAPYNSCPRPCPADGLRLPGLAYSVVDQTLYAVGSPTGFTGHANLYRVDTATAALTLIGDTGVEKGGELGYDPVSGDVFMATNEKLYVLNTGTGAATLIGDTGLTTASGVWTTGFDVDSSGAGLGVDSVSESLSQLYRFNLTTGARTLVGNVENGGWLGISGLAYVYPYPLAPVAATPIPAGSTASMCGLAILIALAAMMAISKE